MSLKFTGDPWECAICRECGEPLLGVYDLNLRFYCYFCGEYEEDEIPPPPLLVIIKKDP